MATMREDLREEIRDNIQEASGVDGAIWSDDLLNRHILREVRSLPRKNIYLEQSWTQTLDPTTDYSSGITLPSGTRKVETVEQNDGSPSFPHWVRLSGVDNYSGAIHLPFTVTSNLEIRVKLKKAFTDPDSDGVELDVPDDVCEVVVWGVTLRCYRILVGYYRNSKSWDSVTKPGEISLSTIQGWVRDAKQEYNDLVKLYATTPRPRDIDLTS